MPKTFKQLLRTKEHTGLCGKI